MVVSTTQPKNFTGQKFTQPSYPGIFSRIDFHLCYKDFHRLYAVMNLTRNKKFLAIRCNTIPGNVSIIIFMIVFNTLFAVGTSYNYSADHSFPGRLIISDLIIMEDINLICNFSQRTIKYFRSIQTYDWGTNF